MIREVVTSDDSLENSGDLHLAGEPHGALALDRRQRGNALGEHTPQRRMRPEEPRTRASPPPARHLRSRPIAREATCPR
jgi:hypothetical protein